MSCAFFYFSTCRFLSGYPTHAIERFLSFVDEWEEKVALELFQSKKVAPGAGLGFLSGAELYAVLTIAAARENVLSKVKETLTLHKLSLSLTEVPAGLLRLALEDDEKSLGWVDAQLADRRPTQMPDNVAQTRTVRLVAEHLKERLRQADELPTSAVDRLWQAATTIYECAPCALGPVAEIVLPRLHDNSLRLKHILHAFDSVLRARGPSLWDTSDQKDDEYPLVLLSNILDNPTFVHNVCTASSTDAVSLTAWMSSLIQSLSASSRFGQQSTDAHKAPTGGNVSGTSTPRRQDTPPPGSETVAANAVGNVGVHADVLKRIMHFLLERLQQPHVQSRVVAIDLAFSLLITEFHALPDFASPEMQTLSRVVGLYARTMTAFAFEGRLPGSAQTVPINHATRIKSHELIQLMLDADCATVMYAIRSLARITQSNLARWRQRKRSGQPNAEEVYATARKTAYPAPVICSELWGNAFQSFRTASSASETSQKANLLLRPLAKMAMIGDPQIHTHILPTPQTESQSYSPYKQVVKSCITGITRCLRTMRQDLPTMFETLAESDVSAGQSVLQELCAHLAPELVIFNLSPVPELHNAAQNVVRSAYPEVESRTDVFQALLSSTTAALSGIERALSLFIDVCIQLVEANDAAKWIVRSGADILEVLCGRTVGLLRSGAAHSYVDRGTEDLIALQNLLPSIWEHMCRSVAVIFQKTPKWSEHIAREDMVAWFRDVNIFSSQLTEQVETMWRAANTRRRKDRKSGRKVSTEEEEEVADHVTSCLSLPLEQAMSWLRINDLEIVHETMQFITHTLDCFSEEVELPERVKDKLLKFLVEQIDIEKPEDRKTLLSTSELYDLQSRLDPTAKAVVISDDEDDASSTGKAGKTKSASSEPVLSQSNWLAAMASPKKGIDADKERQRKKKMRQQKLSFASSRAIDVDALDDGREEAKSATKSAAPSASANKYQGASATPQSARREHFEKAAREAARKPSGPPGFRSGSNMASLRQQHAALHPKPFAHMKKPTPSHLSARDGKPIQAPGAASVVTGAMDGTPSRKQSSDSAESDSSSEEEGDQAAPRGLAALESAKKSPAKSKLPSAPSAPRRTKLLDDTGIEKARKERQEAERKRALRTPTDLRPLHQSILAWDWYSEGDEPPPPKVGVPSPLQAIPLTFRTAQDYGHIMGPLLLTECWAQFQQAKEDFQRGVIPMHPCEIQGRVAVDAFVDISATMTTTTPASWRLTENDVVVMRQRQGASDGQPNERPRIILAKVEMFKRQGQGTQLALRCVLEQDQQGASIHLVNRSVWDVGALFPLNTVHREFAALLTFPYYDLAKDILQAKVAPRVKSASSDIQMMRETYGLNTPQAEAILGSLQGQGFSLVQGPPGTGKTKTICALVAHFVATRKTPQNIGTGGRQATQAIPKKLLMCAPSNAAIDEVARRAKLGMKGPDGRDIKINVVRIGRDDALNIAVKDISLDNLVEQAMAKSAGQMSDGSSVDQLLAEIRSIRDERDSKQSELEQARLSPNANTTRVKQLETEIRALTAKRMNISQRLDEARDKRQTAFRQIDADRRRIRNDILLNADVICSTLSGAGQEALASLPIDFETVVIDEAAQAVELNSIIPLRYGCRRCILVGDPHQLPPTVISQRADKLNYSRSLFVRMFEQAREQVYLLSIQYRMHPDISLHPSKTFYESKLDDGPNMAQLTTRPWHNDQLLAPFRFFSVKGAERPSRGHSYLNMEEASVAVAIYERLSRAASGFDFDGKVGCVTMYKGQVEELKRAFRNRYGADIDKRVDFNTVDGFQGQEKDVIILSCVRSGKNGLGFLTDARRINVAVTRAKASLFIIGNAEGLRDASPPTGLWRQLVDEAQRRGMMQAAHTGTFQAPIGGGRPAIAAPTERKGGRARPAGWIAAEAGAHQAQQGYGQRDSDLEPSSKRIKAEDSRDHSGHTPVNRSPAARQLPPGIQTRRPDPPSQPGSTKPALPPGLQTRRPPTPAPPRTQPVNGSNGPRHGSNGPTRVVRTGAVVQNRPPGPPPVRPVPREAPANPSGGVPGGRPPYYQHQPRPRPPHRAASGTSDANVPSRAAMDALFVKKRKR